MGQYLRTVIILLFSGALVVLFLTMGLALLAAVAITLPFVYWWYRWKINRKLDELNKQSGKPHARIIDVEYEIVDEDRDKS